ncbi:hypothetical protein [Cellulomonas sp. S1-8]|uniref:hypothetical protein n=1 Tax=Cellulomonas sp. S1-8 TaxID=2904790 RepID=UPI0022444379|nr:hypothetical protein [Cellulomonas sp. S1-8]UZN01562.1 hypothetical protein OKX07_10605 [Cellulomonas sp. S1-8]
MQPGVDAVVSVPGMTWVLTALFVVAVFALVFLVGAAFTPSWRRGIASGVVLAVTLVAGFAYAAPRFEAWQEVYDYDATWSRVEARYGVRLSAQDRATTLPGPPGRHGTGIVNQRELGAVVMADGRVRDDLYLQFATGRPVRVAIVTKPAGANELVVSVGGWWDELPVVDEVP